MRDNTERESPLEPTSLHIKTRNIDGIDVDSTEDGSHFSKQRVFSKGTPLRIIDTPEVNDKDTLIRDSKQGEKPGGSWDDEGMEECYSVNERHASVEKAKKRGPVN